MNNECHAVTFVEPLLAEDPQRYVMFPIKNNAI